MSGIYQTDNVVHVLSAHHSAGLYAGIVSSPRVMEALPHHPMGPVALQPGGLPPGRILNQGCSKVLETRGRRLEGGENRSTLGGGQAENRRPIEQGHVQPAGHRWGHDFGEPPQKPLVDGDATDQHLPSS